jgi:hypothetical protein
MNRTLTLTILTLVLLAILIGCESTATTKPESDSSDTGTTLPDLPDESAADEASTPEALPEDGATPDVPIMPAQLDAPAEPNADEAPALEPLPIPATGTDESEDAPAGPAEPAAPETIDELSPVFGNATTIFIGKATAAQMGPMGLSNPPLYNVQLTLNIDESIRGDFETDTSTTVSYQARQQNPPTFTVGESYIVAGHYDTRVERFVADTVLPGTPENLLQARCAAMLPIGWTAADGDLSSPFESMKWPEGVIDADVPTDTTTGRPALLVPEGVTLTAEKVPPVEDVKWSNPDGDGEYTLTVTNTTDQPVEVPALLSDEDGTILWSESLVILVKDTSGLRPQPAPGATMMKGVPQATIIPAGESVSTVVNTFLLQDVEWPQGGYRVEFTFCLGQHGVMKSFYYKTDHHGPIREALTTPPAENANPTGQ